MYTGLLTLEQVADGRLKALRNAEELLADARCLYRKRRWARSYFLSQIAVEEAGKYFYLFSACVMVVSGRIRWPRFWKSVRSHSDKTTLFLMMEEMFIPSAAGPKQIDDLQSDARFLERGKMWSLYADYEQNEFFAPSELIERALTKQALGLAHNRVRLARRFEQSKDWSRTIRRITAKDVEALETMLREKMREYELPTVPVEDADEA